MPQPGLIYRILVASPSDCVHERKVVPEIIYAWNAAHSLAVAAILEPVRWETHAIPELGDRPQGIINKQLVQHCDILIGTFWTRLGTNTGKAESGTAEEIEQFRNSGKRVLLYFSSAPVVPQSLDPGQYAKLLAYKQKLEPDGLCFNYEDITQLRELLHSHLAGVMSEIHSGVQTSLPNRQPSQKEALDMFVAEYQSFMRRFEAEWASERDSEPNGIDAGKYVLNAALQQILSFDQKIIKGLAGVRSLFASCAKELRSLQRHEIFLDGYISFNEFWTRGDAVIESLKRVPTVIEEETSLEEGHAS